jgi:hypothetical protein
MKSKRFLLGMLVVALTFGMMVVGCAEEYEDEDGYEYDNRPSFGSGVMSLDNYYPVVGETITASFTGDTIGTPLWQWYKTEEVPLFSDATNKTSVGLSDTYTVKQSDAGFLLWAELSSSGNRNKLEVRTTSTVIGIPATATVSVSMSAVYFPSRSSPLNNYEVTVTLTLSDGRWDKGSYGLSEWLTFSGSPTISSSDSPSWGGPSVSWAGRKLELSYSTRSDTTLSISNFTATLNSEKLDEMKGKTNVYNTLTAGTSSTVSVSQWTVK